MKTALLGLDIGTTSTKAVLFNEIGSELARVTSKPYHNLTPHPGWVEQDPEEIWQAVLSALRGVMDQTQEEIQVVGICMAAQSGSLLPTDDLGNPVYNLITWMDGRTENLVARWKTAGVQQQVKSVSGWSLYPGLPLPTIAWLCENAPETFAAAQRYFSVNDFITYRLTGKMVSNPSNGGGMQLVNIHTANWSEDLCSLAGIRTDQLSHMQPAGRIIGEVHPEICETIGISSGTKLVNGGHDQVITALGLGVIDPGKLLLACGTAWVFTGVTDILDIDIIPPSMDFNFHIPPQRWAISQSLGGLGASLEWWVSQAWTGDRGERFSTLDAELSKTQPNPKLFFIPLTGGHDDPATTRPGGFAGLQLAHQRADMAYAIMESAGFELRWALEALKNAHMPIESLWMVGGAANSTHWPEILANITGVPIQLPRYDNWPALGAALLAGVGIGLFSDFKAGLNHFNKSAIEINPNKNLIAQYDEKFAAYIAACTQFRQISSGT